jgi:hypothetical protein
MKRIKTPSIASIQLDVFSRRITPAGYQAVLKPLWLKEIFSCITKTPALYNPFITVRASLPGYNYLVQTICTGKKLMITKNIE